jgi:hypothetical protein
MTAIPRAQETTKTVSDEYGNDHTLHINDETSRTFLKHSGDNSEMCPYCNESRDYGFGVRVPN